MTSRAGSGRGGSARRRTGERALWRVAWVRLRHLPGPIKIAGGIGTVAGAIIAVLDLTGRIFGGGGTPLAALDRVALLNPNTTRASFVAQRPSAFPPRVRDPNAVGGVFLVTGHGDAKRYTIRWSVIDGDTGQTDTRAGWSDQLADDFAPNAAAFSRRVWVPIPDGMGSFQVVFDLQARGAHAVESETTPRISLSSSGGG